MTRLRIVALWRYPVKSCAGERVERLVLDRFGPQGDRRWMLVDGNGKFLRQSDHPAMARIRMVQSSDEAALDFGDGVPLALPTSLPNGSETRSAIIWGHSCRLVDEGDAAARWLGERLGTECRLVRMGAGYERQVSLRYGRAGDQTSLTDGFPLTIAARESVDDLNRRISLRGGAPVPVERFRPNILVEGADGPLPIDPRVPERDESGDRLITLPEDMWKRLTVRRDGRTETYRNVKPSARCAITTIDQASGVRTGAEPLATLATYRYRAPRREDDKPEAKVLFCWNLIHDWREDGSPITLRVGDDLEAE